MKRMIAFVLAVLLFCCATVCVSAEDSNVTYHGQSGEFIFAPGSDDSPTDLFVNFKGVMPGDSLTQTVTVKNDKSRDVKVKIYLRSLGAQDDGKSSPFLSQLALRVRKAQDNTMAYMFDAAADQSAQLTDWVELGTLYSGGEVNLEVILDVPTSLDNTYSQQIGYLDWQFKVEEFPTEPSDPDAPQTGDLPRILTVSLCAILSAAIVLILLLARRKKNRTDAS